MKIIILFKDILSQLKSNSVVILRQYPSTFSLRNLDLIQINVQLSLYYKLIDDLKLDTNLLVLVPNLEDVQIPLASKFPNSFLSIKKL